MILHILRALFVLLMAAVGWFYVGKVDNPNSWLSMSVTVVTAVMFVCIDILSPRRKLAVFSGTFFGLFIGLLITYALSFVVEIVVDLYVQPKSPQARVTLVQFLNFAVGITCCYLAISFILQTKEDVRFIIPYVEFAKQTRGSRPVVVDTSILIDGRILELARTGIVDSRLIVPRFVLHELQMIADHGDKLKRARGRRGLEMLNELQNNKRIEVILYEWTQHATVDAEGTDEKLLALAKELNARVLTNDSNLKKVADVRGVDVINLNEVASALRPVVMPGEKMSVRLVKPGEEASQGVGFLEDGTMVVVKDGRPHLGEEIEFTVTNVRQTAMGRMIFGQMGEMSTSRGRGAAAPAPRGRGPEGPPAAPTTTTRADAGPR